MSNKHRRLILAALLLTLAAQVMNDRIGHARAAWIDCNLNGVADEIDVSAGGEIKFLPNVRGHFGCSVALDGATALVGAFNDGDFGATAGAAYVFVNSSGLWQPAQKLYASDARSASWFGWAVALDGDRALIGARYDLQNGSTYIYENVGASWVEQGKLRAPDGAALDEFGASVSLVGNTALIGAPRDDDNGSDAGAVYVFVNSNGHWDFQAKLLAPDGAPFEFFGWRVAQTEDWAAIGAFADDDLGTDSGSVHVYERVDGEWTWAAKLLASAGKAGDRFGAAVALDDDVLLVGAPQLDNADAEPGSVHDFRLVGGAWQLNGVITPPDASTGGFGFAVSLKDATALISCPRDDEQSSGAGAVYAFRSNETSWISLGRLTASDGAAGDQFGRAMAHDGDLALVGAEYDDDLGLSSGSAYLVGIRSTDCDANEIPDECSTFEFGDTDGDGDVDAADIAEFIEQLAGPGSAEVLEDPCRIRFDFDDDLDIDLRDFAEFARVVSP